MREWTLGTRRGMRLRKRRGVIHFVVKNNNQPVQLHSLFLKTNIYFICGFSQQLVLVNDHFRMQIVRDEDAATLSSSKS